MRVLAALLASALAASADEPAITLVRASKAHGKLFRTETLVAAWDGKKGTLTIDVEVK